MTLEKPQTNGPEQFPAAPETPSSTEQMTEEKRMSVISRLGHWIKETWTGRITTAAVGATLAAGITVASVEAANNHSDRQTVATSTPNPGESDSPAPTDTSAPETTPTPEATASNQAEIAQATQERQKYMDISVAEFEALPQPEKVVFLVLTNKIHLQAAEAAWQKVTNNPADVSPTVTVDSSPQDIVDSTNWQTRLMLSLSGDERAKYMLAMFQSGESSPSYKVASEDAAQFPDGANLGILAYQKKLPNPTVVGARDVDHGLNNLISRGIDIESATTPGAVGTFQLYFQQVTLPDGTTEGVWIVE